MKWINYKYLIMFVVLIAIVMSVSLYFQTDDKNDNNAQTQIGGNGYIMQESIKESIKKSMEEPAREHMYAIYQNC